MQKNYIWIIGLSLFLGFCVYQSNEDEKKRELERIENNKQELLLSNKIKVILEKYGANTKWSAGFQNYDLDGPILTSSKLEELWFEDENIALLGKVQDVMNKDEASYYLKIEPSIFFLQTFSSLNWHLKIDKTKWDQFVLENPNALNQILPEPILVIASISNVISEKNIDGNMEFIGKGEIKDVTQIEYRHEIFVTEQWPFEN